jgi:cobalt/nickel transport system ATP-binding protein
MEAQERGKTVVTSTNDLHIVSEIAGRVVVLSEDRRVLASGTPEAILQDRSILRAANLLHRHRHAHEGIWHEHEHEHPGAFHGRTHEARSADGAG